MLTYSSKLSEKAEGALKPMELAHVGAVVKIHMSSFQSFFLTSLGPSFLGHLYKGIVESPLGMGFIIVENHIPMGFVCGAINASDFYKELLKRRWFQFALSALPALIRRPATVPRLFRALKKPYESKRGSTKAILMSIGVHPAAQGRKYGKILVSAFLGTMRQCGVDEVSLTTDKDHNDPVNTFYQKMGFTIRRTFVTPEGRRMNEYVIKP